jgi:hypothetical protein
VSSQHDGRDAGACLLSVRAIGLSVDGQYHDDLCETVSESAAPVAIISSSGTCQVSANQGSAANQGVRAGKCACVSGA